MSNSLTAKEMPMEAFIGLVFLRANWKHAKRISKILIPVDNFTFRI